MNNHVPLAERIRPQTIDELTGQLHLTGQGSILRKAIENGRIPSMILWGPPGTGKTTIANIIANTLKAPFFMLSAISSGVKEVRYEYLNVFNKKIETIGTALPFENTFSKNTLFLRGDKSDYILDSDFETIYHHFPMAKIETIKNAGHWLHAENPKDFYLYVIDFIK